MAPVFPAEVEDALRREAKAELRKSLRRQRAMLGADARAAADLRLRATLAAFYPGVRVLASFATIERKGEPMTRGIHADARALGIRVCYPALEGEEMVFRACEEPPTEEQGRGFPEPTADAPLVAFEDIDLMFVPGLGFDPTGHRIGYGAGYYDRTLPRCTRAKKVGIAFDLQIVAEVPVRPGDVPVDVVVTDRRVFRREEELL